MITLKTQAAIAVLDDIYTGEKTTRTNKYSLSEEDRCTLLSKLTTAGIIQLVDLAKPQEIHSYPQINGCITTRYTRSHRRTPELQSPHD